MSKVKVSVCIHNDHIDQIGQVSDSLRASGMDIEQTMPNIGIVSGSIESQQIEQLQEIAGVDSVELEQNYQLPPPNSPLQ
jgi:hypothetical protein